MPAYIGPYKFAPQGLGNIIKGSPERIARSKALAEKMGARAISVWATLGEYDLVTIGEMPDDEAAAAFPLAQASQGNVTIQTIRAFSEEEFAGIVSRLP